MFKNKGQVNNKTKEKTKITLGQLVWLGFNYTCGIAFPMALIGIYYWDSGNNGVGLNLLWIIVVCALIAGGTAWSFIKCSKIYHNSNGGAYVYVRAVFGRFFGWIIGFIQYIAIPAATIVTIISMFRVNLNQLPIFDWVPNRWSSLVIDSIGIIVYILASSLIYFGMRGFKLFINISGIIKWGSTIFLIVCTIILIIDNHGLAFQQAAQGTKNIHLTLTNLNNAFSSFFYFFIGFETFAVIGKNLQNPQKTFGKGTIIILSLATIFYLIVTILVVGAITFQGPNNNGWAHATSNYNPNNVIAGIAGIAGMIVLVISTLSLKLNGTIQNALYSGAMIEPLAKEGYITEKLAKVNEQNIALRASTVNLIITTLVCIIMLVIPDLFGVSFDFNTVLNFSTNIVIVIYLFVLLATIIMGLQHKIKVNIWELIIFLICLAFLLSQFVLFNYGIIKEMVLAQGVKIISSVIEFLMLWFFIFVATIWYFIYYVPKLKLRLKNNPEIQKKLDAEFNPVSYVTNN